MGVISSFLYVYLGPQNSKYTFKNKQAINGNNSPDMQLGRQEVNGEIEDICAGSQRAERDSTEQAHRLCGLGAHLRAPEQITV